MRDTALDDDTKRGSVKRKKHKDSSEDNKKTKKKKKHRRKKNWSKRKKVDVIRDRSFFRPGTYFQHFLNDAIFHTTYFH